MDSYARKAETEMSLADVPFLDIPFPRLLLGVGASLMLLLVLSSLVIFATNRRVKPGASRSWLSKLLYLAYVILISVLAGTSFGSILKSGHMAGYALLAHVAAAAGFMFLLVVIALLYLPNSVDFDEPELREYRWWAARWSAWALILSSIVATGTMLLSMLPMLDTQGLRDMATLHRYAGLAVVVAAIVHLFALACTKLGWR